MSQTYSQELKEQVVKKVQATQASTQSEYGAAVGSRGTATGHGQAGRLVVGRRECPVEG